MFECSAMQIGFDTTLLGRTRAQRATGRLVRRSMVKEGANQDGTLIDYTEQLP